VSIVNWTCSPLALRAVVRTQCGLACLVVKLDPWIFILLPLWGAVQRTRLLAFSRAQLGIGTLKAVYVPPLVISKVSVVMLWLQLPPVNECANWPDGAILIPLHPNLSSLLGPQGSFR
jgi:hypothetical protein